MLTVVINGREIVVHDEERQPCECWTRVMGYFRPVSDWNIGKRGEHAERKYLTESNELTRTPVCTP
jgi:hypothetical protein